MTIWVCKGLRGCYTPCELNDFTVGLVSLPDGVVHEYCKFTGEPVDWELKK